MEAILRPPRLFLVFLMCALTMSGCYALGAPLGIGDMKDLSDTHCISADFEIGGPPPGGKISGNIRPKYDGACFPDARVF